MLLSYNSLMVAVVSAGVMQRPNPIVHGALSPIDREQVNSASIDITLGDAIMIEKPYPGPNDSREIDLRAREALVMDKFYMNRDKGYVLKPGEFILAQSHELFFLPNNLSAEYKLKSSMARVGLEHLNAGWCDAGWNGSVLTLELKNMTEHHSIRIRPGDRIGQVVFFRHDMVPTDRSYGARGHYNGDTSVTGAKS